MSKGRILITTVLLAISMFVFCPFTSFALPASGTSISSYVQPFILPSPGDSFEQEISWHMVQSVEAANTYIFHVSVHLPALNTLYDFSRISASFQNCRFIINGVEYIAEVSYPNSLTFAEIWVPVEIPIANGNSNFSVSFKADFKAHSFLANNPALVFGSTSPYLYIQSIQLYPIANYEFNQLKIVLDSIEAYNRTYLPLLYNYAQTMVSLQGVTNTKLDTLHNDNIDLRNNLAILRTQNNDNLLAIQNQNTVIQNNQSTMIGQNSQIIAQLMEQNKNLTEFDQKSEMDSSKTELDSSINDYDQVEGSIFENASSNIEKFDLSSALTPSPGVVAGISFVGQFVLGLITGMGEFSVIFTIGVALSICTLVFGLSRAFIGGIVSSDTSSRNKSGGMKHD